MDYEKKYKEALEKAKRLCALPTDKATMEEIFPELRESEDERMRKLIIDRVRSAAEMTKGLRELLLTYLEKQKEEKPSFKQISDSIIWDSGLRTGIELGKEEQKSEQYDIDVLEKHITKDSISELAHTVIVRNGWEIVEKEQKPIECIEFDNEFEKQVSHLLASVLNGEWEYDEGFVKHAAQSLLGYAKQELKPIKMGIYEIGKGTTVCGQDYKCKKDYKTGTCWYIKDAIYHCSRDGYLNDQNGVSWSCTPEWFKEYIQSNTEWAEEEKTRFVSGQFLQCKLSFDEFKEDEHYWLEYIGDDTYVGRSDNILNQKFHITPRQLYTLFSQQLEENEKEQKQVNSLDTMLSKDPHLPKQAVKCEQKPVDNGIREKIISRATSEKQVVLISESSGNAEIGWDTRSLEDAKNLLEYGISFINKQLGVKPAEWNYDNRIQYDSIKSGIEAFASTYSFNIESKLFPQLTKEQQRLWREEIEQAVIAGGEDGAELARDNRYKENRTIEWSEEDERMRNQLIYDIEHHKKDGLISAKQNKATKALYNGIEKCYDEKIAWLKSLHPVSKESLQPHWKPSDEQMNHLSAAVIEAQRRHNESVNGFPRYRVLKELYEQLKKLM